MKIIGFIRTRWNLILLGLIMLGVFFLNFWNIGQEGYGNSYYAATVKSMLTSWHNFFFASFDPGGFVTVDKPAMGLWIQCVFALIFGVHGWSMILPEALCAVATVGVGYQIISKDYGKVAGIITAAALGTTPILIAVSRTNNLDSSLVLVCILAIGAAINAAEKGSLKWLILSLGLIGLGFNIKMLQAYMILPAIYGVYLFTAKVGYRRRIRHLAIATAVLLLVSMAWPVAVDLTQKEDRPYIGSSQTNSVIELALGYNGIQRLLGRGGNSDGSERPAGMYRPERPANGEGMMDMKGQPGPGGNGGMGQGGPGGTGENGEKSPLRLFNQELSGQIAWFLVLALLSALVMLWELVIKRKILEESGDKRDLRHLIAWSGWILPMIVFFSVAGFYHRYYLAMMAPGIAGLVGIGIIKAYELYKKSNKTWFVLPLLIAITAVVQGIVLTHFIQWRAYLIPIATGIPLLSAALILILKRVRWSKGKEQVGKAAIAISILALLIAPTVWATTPLIYGSSSTLPYTGPDLGRSGGDIGNGNTLPRKQGMMTVPGDRNGGSLDAKAIAYLISKRKTEKYVLAVSDANSAASIYLNYGAPVMAMGGFSGTDNIMTVTKLQVMVKNGELRFVQIGGRMGGQGQGTEVTEWIRENGQPTEFENIYDLALNKD